VGDEHQTQRYPQYQGGVGGGAGFDHGFLLSNRVGSVSNGSSRSRRVGPVATLFVVFVGINMPIRKNLSRKMR
jgi:hypothetical protein